MRLFGMYAKIYERKGVVLLSSLFSAFGDLRNDRGFYIYFLICHDHIPQVETELNILILSDLPLCCQDD